MSNLPEDIRLEIFFRLPRKSILRFRCVSKSFLALFDSRSFKAMYYVNMQRCTRITVREAIRNKAYTINYESVSSLLPLSSTSSGTIFDCHEIFKRMDYPSVFQDCEKLRYVCLINDFRCMRTMKNSCEEFYIWNLKTKECKKIPMERQVNSNHIEGYGFCYDYKTDDYKFVRVVVDLASKCSNAHVYTLSSNSWKSIQSMPYNLCYHHYGVLFQGALHWLVRSFQDASTVLVYFDSGNERFQQVALPAKPIPYPEEPLIKDRFRINMEVFGGCLCLFYHVFNVRVDVWMMQEYGVKESWTKSFSTTLESITSGRFSRLIWNFKNDETLWQVDGHLILYDPNNNIYRKLMWE